MADSPQLLLGPYRVLDLTGGDVLLCGKILADLGADVVQIEPPGGSTSRRTGPFYGDDPHPDRSLLWWAYCAGKRSITLNLDSADGRIIFKRLIESADFLIESFAPGCMAGLGLAYADLEKISPSLVMVSITDFGQEGPYSGYQAADIVDMALGGFMHLTGDGDRPPLTVGCPQARRHGAAAGAMGRVGRPHPQGPHWRRPTRRRLLSAGRGQGPGPRTPELGHGRADNPAHGSVSADIRRHPGQGQLALQGRAHQLHAPGRQRRLEHPQPAPMDAR